MRMIINVLKNHIKKGYCIVFMDDISVASDTKEEYGHYVYIVMDTLRKNNFNLKEKKCFFGRSATKFVGYQVIGSGIRILEWKITSITGWPMISSSKNTRIFLRPVGAYRKFIPNFGELAAPLNKLTNLTKLEFNSYIANRQNYITISDAIQQIKMIMTADPCLALPRKDIDNFIVWTDASDFGIGAILRQIQQTSDGSNQEFILVYFSRKLHRAETRYSTYEKTLLAIKDVLNH
jgi:hypothetical protein